MSRLTTYVVVLKLLIILQLSRGLVKDFGNAIKITTVSKSMRKATLLLARFGTVSILLLKTCTRGLNTTLSNSNAFDADCFETIKNLGKNSNLNHGGPNQ